ncbi:hypothetical protein M2408_002297 [Sphingobacterium sp. BIGb0165]|nr:hypothetical protein [Sphingobacterium sp. BIGb0165]
MEICPYKTSLGSSIKAEQVKNFSMIYKYKQIKFPLYVKIKKNNKNTDYGPYEPIFIQNELTGLTFVTIATIFFHSYKKIT